MTNIRLGHVVARVLGFALAVSAHVGAASTGEVSSAVVKDWCTVDPARAAARSILESASRHRDDHPHALAHVHTEGTLPHQGIRDQSLEAEVDWQVALRAALAWQVGHDPRYLRQVDAYLLAWAGTYEPDFNPIDETNLDALIEAYALTRRALHPPTRAAMQALLHKLGEGYLERMHALSRSLRGSEVNNWQSHRIKLVALAGAALGDGALLQEATLLFQQQVAGNIHADGSVHDFSERDALHYVVYDLQPLVQAAVAVKPYASVDDWLHYETAAGASLAKALDWLRPYADGSRSHEEFVHSKVKFDAARAQAGVSGFSGLWDPRTGTALYWLAARLDPRYLAVAKKLSAQPPDWIGVCR